MSLLSFVGHMFEGDMATRLLILTTSQSLYTSLTFFILYVGILGIHPNKGLVQVVTKPHSR
jgi:hypothetical protein